MNTQIYPQSSAMLLWQTPLAEATMREVGVMGQSGAQAAWVQLRYSRLPPGSLIALLSLLMENVEGIGK